MDSASLLYFKARHLTMSVAALVAVAAVAAVTVRAEVSMPDITQSGSGTFPVPVLLPLIPAVLLSVVSEAPDPDLELLSIPPIRRYRLVHLLLVIAAATIALAPYSGDPIYHEAVRNLLGFSGAALIGAYFFGHERGWALAVGPVLLGTLFAGRAGGIATWAWYLQPATVPGTWAVAVAMLIVGVALMVRGTRHVN